MLLFPFIAVFKNILYIYFSNVKIKCQMLPRIIVAGSIVIKGYATNVLR